jgi:hypothetical protein
MIFIPSTSSNSGGKGHLYSPALSVDLECRKELVEIKNTLALVMQNFVEREDLQLLKRSASSIFTPADSGITPGSTLKGEKRKRNRTFDDADGAASQGEGQRLKDFKCSRIRLDYECKDVRALKEIVDVSVLCPPSFDQRPAVSPIATPINLNYLLMISSKEEFFSHLTQSLSASGGYLNCSSQSQLMELRKKILSYLQEIDSVENLFLFYSVLKAFNCVDNQVSLSGILGSASAFCQECIFRPNGKGQSNLFLVITHTLEILFYFHHVDLSLLRSVTSYVLAFFASEKDHLNVNKKRMGLCLALKVVVTVVAYVHFNVQPCKTDLEFTSAVMQTIATGDNK